MSEEYTPRSHRALLFSRTEAARFGSDDIKPYHLLLGLFGADPRLSARLFDDPEAPERIREKLESRFLLPHDAPLSGDLPLAYETRRALAYAVDECQDLGHTRIATGHLLLGLLRELGLLWLLEAEGGAAAELLLEHGAKPFRLREEVAMVPETPGDNTDDRSESDR